MKIIYVTSSPLKGGGGEHITKTVEGLISEGVEVKIICPSTSRTGILGSLKNQLEINELIRKMVRTFCPDMAYIRYGGGEILNILEIVKNNIPYVLELNSNVPKELLVMRKFINFIIYQVFSRYVFTHASGIAAVSNSIYEDCCRITKIRKPFLLVRDGVDLNEIAYHNYDPSLRRQWDTPEDAPLLVMIGWLAPWLGMDILFNALASRELEKYYLWFIGDMDKDFVRDIVREKSVSERIRLIPWQVKKDLSRLLSAGDVGIGALALYRKGLSNYQLLKTRTYLAAGLPTFLGYDDPFIPKTCSFISSGAYPLAGVLAPEIKRFYDHVKVNRVALGREARRFAEEQFSWRLGAKETAVFLKSLKQ